MTIEVLIEAGAGEIRVALVADGKLEESDFGLPNGEVHIGLASACWSKTPRPFCRAPPSAPGYASG